MAYLLDRPSVEDEICIGCCLGYSFKADLWHLYDDPASPDKSKVVRACQGVGMIGPKLGLARLHHPNLELHGLIPPALVLYVDAKLPMLVSIEG